MPERLRALAQVNLYDAGYEGYNSYQGFAHGSAMIDEFSLCTPSVITIGGAKYQGIVLMPVGGSNGDMASAIPCPRVVAQDTEIADWTATTGEWQEWTPQGGSKRTRLVQADATEGQSVLVESQFDLPPQPNFALSLYCMDVPDDETPGTDTGIYFVFGDGEWCIASDRASTGYLFYLDGADWIQALQFPWRVHEQESVCAVMCLRQRIVITTDGWDTVHSWSTIDDETWAKGATDYELPAYGEAGEGAYVLPGTMSVVSTGGIFMFGLHQVAFETGATLTSPEIAMYDEKDATPGYAMWKTCPEDTWLGYEAEELGILTSLAIAREAASDNYHTQWKVTFTTDTYTPPTAPWAFHYAPELHRVDLGFDVEQEEGTGSYADLGTILSVDVDLPAELDAAQGDITVFLGGLDDKAFNTANYRERLVDIQLGYVYDDDSTNLTRVMTGHIDRITPQEENSRGEATAHVTILGRLARLARVEIDETWVAGDGQTLAERAEYIVAKCGYSSSLHLDTANLDATTLATGTPERLAWIPQVGQSALEHLKDIAALSSCVVMEDADGVIGFADYDTFDASPSATFDATADADDLRHLIKWIGNEMDYDQWYTAVVVKGETPSGVPVWAFENIIDQEQTPANANFLGYRKTLRLSGGQYIDTTTAQAVADAQLTMNAYPKAQPHWRVWGCEDLVRRNTVTILNSIVGLAGTEGEVGILGIHHSWNDGVAEIETEFSGRILA